MQLAIDYQSTSIWHPYCKHVLLLWRQAVLHQHAVHKVSFIARDATDSRAFGYIYGPGDGTHQFFGVKTEKAVSPYLEHCVGKQYWCYIIPQ